MQVQKITREMKDSKNQKAVSLSVTENLKVTILPNSEHEYLMTSREVENGYGVTEHALRMSRIRNGDELLEGKHFVLGKGVTNCYPSISIQSHQVLWTKRGIVRLGFFIKSERAKLFRDWAEDLILNKTESVSTKELPPKRKHNRLTQDRLVDIMADICLIKDDQLRESLVNKLLNQ